jgi:predicted enzyme related to lactoylglutathione lyase
MAERSSYAAGIPSWVDLATTDPAAARDFYGQLFGWDFEIGPEEFGFYTTARKGGRSVAGLVGMPMSDNPPAWTTYFATDDAQQTSELAAANGAAIVVGAMPVGALGTMLVFQDPTGAFAGAWQAGSHTGAQLVNEPGAVTWNELLTRDLDAAIAFYTAILPVTTHDNSEEHFRYQTLQVDGKDVAGLWEATADTPHDTAPHWTVYFAVEDADEAVSRAESLGASVSAAAVDSPYGRFARLSDPQGARFTVIKNP